MQSRVVFYISHLRLPLCELLMTPHPKRRHISFQTLLSPRPPLELLLKGVQGHTPPLELLLKGVQGHTRPTGIIHRSAFIRKLAQRPGLRKLRSLRNGSVGCSSSLGMPEKRKVLLFRHSYYSVQRRMWRQSKWYPF
jgi:hypothetical protein